MDGSMSLVMVQYGNLTWTSGVYAGGDPRTGLGGNAAVVSSCYLLNTIRYDRRV